MQLRLARQPEEVARHAHEPGTARPEHPFGDAAALGDEVGWDDRFVGEDVDVLDGLEGHVGEALDEGDFVGDGVFAFGGVLVKEGFEEHVEGEEAREAKGGAQVADHHGKGCEEGGGGCEGGGGEFGLSAQCALQGGDDLDAGWTRGSVEVGDDIEAIVEGAETGS